MESRNDTTTHSRSDSTTSSVTTSISRSYDDLHAPAFFASLFGLAALRTVCVQPLNVYLVTRRLDMKDVPFTRILSSRALWTTALPAFVAGGALSESLSLFTFEAIRSATSSWLGSQSTPSSSSSSSSSSIPTNESSAAADFCAGFLSDGVRQIFLTPFAVVATQQVMTKISLHNNDGLFRTSQRIWSQNGKLRGLYSGFGTSMAVGPIWTASWWVLYNNFKRSLYASLDPYLKDGPFSDGVIDSAATVVPWWQCRGDNVLIDTSASILASASAVVFFNPFLVVRTRLMATPGSTLRSVLSILRAEAAANRGATHYGGGSRRGAFLRLLFAGTAWSIPQNVLDGIGASLTYEHARRWAEKQTS
ncbi:mitochondrial carrier protein, putative [Bodo saltans]|uniref:Mitochondrial carrier protein, putative n=1 Tax=Bodo saltans TaxID=75058 RepID=A0A0S4JIT1_BODSA|nr:mitochondrial carrier protein, putative [Bodo saltans]|eukprot:CUG90214.1 mitochondrial carrier protein, putative [Bodo saltans]